MCVTTAVAAATFVVVLAIAELVLHHTNHQWPSRSSENTSTTNTTNVSRQQPPSPTLGSGDAAFLAVVAALGLLAAITAGLLLHLCFFHIYISFLGLTTYEYIRQQRQSQQLDTNRNPNVQEERSQVTTETSSVRMRCPTFRNRPVNLHHEESSRMTIFTCTVLEEDSTVNTATEAPEGRVMCANVEHDTPAGIVKTRKVKKRWNCCVSVPDSPDSPVEHRCLTSLCKHIVKTKSNVPAIEGRKRSMHGYWSSAKLRVFLRVFGNFGHGRRRHQAMSAKSNQVLVSTSIYQMLSITKKAFIEF